MLRKHWAAALLGLLLCAHVAQAQLISGGTAGGGSGTVTSIATTGPITGGTITGTGTIACATCVVASSALTSSALTVGGSGQGIISLASAAGFLKSEAGTLTYSSVSVNNITATGTPSSSTFLRGDGTWNAASCATCLVASSALTNNQLLVSSSGVSVLPLTFTSGFLRAGSPPSGASVSLSNEVSGTLPTSRMPTSTLYRTCTVVVGADNGSALVDADIGPQRRQCFVAMAGTIVEVTVSSDAGTPSVMLQRNTASSATTNLLSSNLASVGSGIACANVGGTTGLDLATTCSASLSVTSLSPGTWIDLSAGVAGGTAKRLTVGVTWTVN